MDEEKDVAVCRRCGKSHPAGEVYGHAALLEMDLTRPPKGVWLRRKPTGFELGASTRSWEALFLVPFTAIWAGGTLAGLYGTQIARGEFSLVQTVWGLPFLVGSIVLITLTMMKLAGRVEVRVNGTNGEVFKGVGPVGKRRRFSWTSESKVTWEEGIVLDDGRQRVKLFPRERKMERSRFLGAALKQMQKEFRY